MLLPLRRLAMIICVVCLSNSLMAADWPQWRGLERNAHSDEQLTSTDWGKNPPKHLWTTSGFGEGYASVAIVKGTLYTLGNTDGGQAVIAAKADDGNILWKKVITDANPNRAKEILKRANLGFQGFEVGKGCNR